MKRTKNIRWRYVVLALLLIVAIASVANGLNGNPLSLRLAEQRAVKHVEATYPETAYDVVGRSYEPKMGAYLIEFVEHGDVKQVTVNEEGIEETNTYTIAYDGLFGTRLRFDDLYIAHLDEPLQDRLSEEASSYLKEQLQPIVGSPIEDVIVTLEVTEGTVPPTTTWSPSFIANEPMDLSIALNDEDWSKEQLEEQLPVIQRALREQGISYETCHVTIYRWMTDTEEPFPYLLYSSSFHDRTNVFSIESFNEALE